MHPQSGMSGPGSSWVELPVFSSASQIDSQGWIAFSYEIIRYQVGLEPMTMKATLFEVNDGKHVSKLMKPH